MLTRRSFLNVAGCALASSAFEPYYLQAQERAGAATPIGPVETLRITKLELIRVKPRWTFLKIHTDAGVVGLGEPIVESRSKTTAEAVREMEPYLIGKDPRRVQYHWQAIYRHAFYRGGPVLTSALSGVDVALWDIKGKALGIPVYEFFGGPTRDRVRVYSHAGTPEQVKADYAKGFRAFKTGPAKQRAYRIVETPAAIAYSVEKFAELRQAAGQDSDIGIDFHGAIPPQSAKILIKGLEPYQPMFIEEPCQAQNHNVMADIARSTHLPIATGERVFTKWGFREVLEAEAASILQPDIAHAGGISETRSIAAMGEGYLKKPFEVRDGYVDLPSGPGLGIELDDDYVRSQEGHDYRPAETYDADDGSVVDR